MIDTHAHLDGLGDDLEPVLARARDAAVETIIAVGSGIDSAASTLAIAGRNAGVFAALGIHPHQAGDGEAERVGELRDLFASTRAVAVGETGLDFYRDYAPHDRQLRLFEEQLELAETLGKTVVIHSRAAEAATARTLEGFRGTVVLHCFSGPGLLEVALERDYFVSFAGNVTYPQADDLRAAAARVPGNRILAETDTPYLAPQPVRGRPNEPAHVVHTVAALAAAREEAPDGLAAQIEANAKAAFALP